MTHTHDDHDEHDLGFAHDLPRLMGRRAVLFGLGGAALAAASPAAALDCVALPWETAGPFPADGSNLRDGQTVNALTQSGILREDLRTSFGNLSGTADGARLDLAISLQDAAGCTPLAGHAIYLWACDAQGRYSLYDLPQQNYQRGLGVADANGSLRFTTVFPGCYPGRWPHFHFEVFATPEAAVSGEASLLTAQMALPRDVCEALYAADARYDGSTANLVRLTLASDMVFADNSDAQIAQQTPAVEATGDGYAGTITIPVDLTAQRPAGRGMAPRPRG